MNEPHFVTREGAIADSEYLSWLAQVKQQYRSSQAKAAVRVNSAMLEFYWTLGRDISTLQAEAKWGTGFFSNLSLDLQAEFPGQKGLSVTNLKYVKRWYQFYHNQLLGSGENRHQPVDDLSDDINALFPIRQRGVDELSMPDLFALVSWRQHIEIFTRSQSLEEAVFYIQQSIANNWGRDTLVAQIKQNLYHTQGAAITNFDDLMPSDQSRLAQSMLKGSYHLDFLNLGPEHSERQLEDALAENITRFLLELGQGFSYVGRQMELRMDEETSFFPDLVFYHYRQRRFVVVELKAREFQPEHAGKINFYVNAADNLLRGEGDQASVGLLICRTAKRAVVEWSLKGINTPLGVATYQLEELVNRTIAEVEQQKQ